MKVVRELDFSGDDRYTNNIRDRLAGMVMECYAEIAGSTEGQGDWSKLPPFDQKNILKVTVEVVPAKK